MENQIKVRSQITGRSRSKPDGGDARYSYAPKKRQSESDARLTEKVKRGSRLLREPPPPNLPLLTAHCYQKRDGAPGSVCAMAKYSITKQIYIEKKICISVSAVILGLLLGADLRQVSEESTGSSSSISMQRKKKEGKKSKRSKQAVADQNQESEK